MTHVYSVPTEMTSPRWCNAFVKGCRGSLVTANALQTVGPVALFGSPARWDVLQRARNAGRTWFYGDHAYFGRHHFYRVTRDAFQHDAAGEAAPARFEKHGIRLSTSWRDNGSHIVLCPSSPRHFLLFGDTAEAWIARTIAELRRHTDREIRVRFKNDARPFEEDLRGAWAVVGWLSVCGVLAALDGIPCFATAPCASRSFGTGDLSLIESPVRPDNRFEMACVLAANQWTLSEIASGNAWRALH